MADFSMSQNSTPEQEQQTSSSNRFFIPIIFSFSSHPRTDQTDQDQDQETNRSSDHVVTISFFNQDMMMMIPSLKDVPLPASKASIEAMRKIKITKNDQEDGECSICLEGWKIGEEVKEMPCKHQYHSNCIEKWLGIHGSCPVCRFKMPVDEEGNNQERRTRVERELSDEETRFVMNLLELLMPSNNNNNNQEN